MNDVTRRLLYIVSALYKIQGRPKKGEIGITDFKFIHVDQIHVKFHKVKVISW